MRPIVKFVRIQIHSNYGSKTHTCIYRVAVHGEILK